MECISFSQKDPDIESFTKRKEIYNASMFMILNKICEMLCTGAFFVCTSEIALTGTKIAKFAIYCIGYKILYNFGRQSDNRLYRDLSNMFWSKASPRTPHLYDYVWSTQTNSISPSVTTCHIYCMIGGIVLHVSKPIHEKHFKYA